MDLGRVGVRLGGAPVRLDDVVGLTLSKPLERRGDRARVGRLDDGAVDTFSDYLGTSSAGARHHRESRGERLQMDVAERLVPARKHHDVRAGIPALWIGPGAEPDRPLADAQPRSERPVFTSVALAEDDETAAAIGERRERLYGGREALAREPAAHEEDGERARGDAGLAPRGLPVPRAILGMEALEVDTVVDDGDPARRHGVQRADQTRGRALDAAVEDERPRDDEELHCSGCLEHGFDRGWPEIDARGSDTPKSTRGIPTRRAPTGGIPTRGTPTRGTPTHSTSTRSCSADGDSALGERGTRRFIRGGSASGLQ